jgi:hypothetical protein
MSTSAERIPASQGDTPGFDTAHAQLGAADGDLGSTVAAASARQRLADPRPRVTALVQGLGPAGMPVFTLGDHHRMKWLIDN